MAMNVLGNGLHEAERHADALTVREAELSMRLRLGAFRRTFSPCRAILRKHMTNLDGLKRPCACDKTYILDV